jgi:hypothetical protein
VTLPAGTSLTGQIMLDGRAAGIGDRVELVLTREQAPEIWKHVGPFDWPWLQRETMTAPIDGSGFFRISDLDPGWKGRIAVQATDRGYREPFLLEVPIVAPSANLLLEVPRRP